MLPRAFERLNRRTLLSPAAIVATAVVAARAARRSATAVGRPSVILASLYSFGILLAFTAAQLAVVRLRADRARLERPVSRPAMPFAGVSPRARLTGAIWVLAVATHDAARIAGPVWLAGLGVYVLSAVARHGADRRVRPAVADLVPRGRARTTGSSSR